MRVPLGDALRALRKSRGVSLRKLESLGGPSRESERLYEAGTTIPTTAALERLLVSLGEPLDSAMSTGLLRQAAAARGDVHTGLTEQQQQQLIDTVVRLVLARDARRESPAIQLDAQLEVRRELRRLGLIQGGIL
jgi:transcriptional regulator with XRE-family HTH domain